MSVFRYAANRLETETKELTPEIFEAITNDPQVVMHCDHARENVGNKKVYEANKYALPVAFYCGYNKDGRREAEYLTPTQMFMIDIDHAKMSAQEIWADLYNGKMISKFELIKEDAEECGAKVDGLHGSVLDFFGIKMVHETPSGGLRLIVQCTRDFTTLKEHIEWFMNYFDLSDYGKLDTVVNDLSRASFMVKKDWMIYIAKDFFDYTPADHPILQPTLTTSVEKSKGGKAGLPEITDEMRNISYGGKHVSDIAKEYIIDLGGVPEEGLRHGFYNDLVKNFRNICDNDPRIVFAVLPLCEGTPEKRWSQCTSICKSNNTTKIPKDFYFWLKRRGLIITKKDREAIEYMESEAEEREPLPPLPPVFREFCAICPPDFIYPTIVALLPVMGTLTSYVKADYIDLTEQTTTFFSCVWAPPSCGKSFAKRIVDLLMRKIKIRDEINNIREQLWLVDERTRAKDDKGNDLPHVMVRIMPAINSLPEFLEKMRDNRGFHMFTFAEEVDTFKKGSSSGGSDKSDLFRTAWDNSEYGQSFKSAATFKGMVKVYYNILLTGTPGAVQKYYSNIEDGMVTRISICEIENQQFAKFQAWKPLTNRQLEIIDRFVERCDANTYQEPVDMDSDDIHLYDSSSTEFDKNVKWKFKLRAKTRVDMSWINNTILAWLEKTRISASLANDAAADVFRRRVAVKGFRLALVCTCCWSSMKERERKIVKDFVVWFMNRDLQESLKMFGEKYNKLQSEVQTDVKRHSGLFEALSDEFSKNDVIAQCIKMGIHSRISQILWRWKKDKVITKISNDTYKKAKRNDKN